MFRWFKWLNKAVQGPGCRVQGISWICHFAVLSACGCLFLPACAGKKEEHAQKKAGVPAVEVRAKTDRTTATISQPITYTLSALYPKEITIAMPEVGPQIAGLRIVDFGEEGPKDIDNRREFIKWYKLQADIIGSYIIPAMTVSCADDNGTLKELKTPQIFLEVTSALTDEKGDRQQDIIDIKPLQEVPRDLRPFMIAGGIVLVLLATSAGAFFYFKKRKRGALELQRPAHVIALEELEKLQREKLIEKGVVREHYFRLSDIFRHYIENRFSISAVEQTTQELLPAIRKLGGLSEKAQADIKEVLFHSDMVKFAKYIPAEDENEQSHRKVVGVINETKKEETPQDNEERGRHA